jgi:hypothetical protein
VKVIIHRLRRPLMTVIAGPSNPRRWEVYWGYAAIHNRPMRAGGGGLVDRVLLAAACLLALVPISGPLWWRRVGDFDPLVFAHAIAVGLSLILGGFIASRWRSGRPIARLMLVTACIYFIPYIGQGRSEIAYGIGLLTYGLWLATAGHFVVAFPEGRLRTSAERVVVGAGYVWAVAVHAGSLFYDPRDFDCLDCPANPLLIARNPDVVFCVLRRRRSGCDRRHHGGSGPGHSALAAGDTARA